MTSSSELTVDDVVGLVPFFVIVLMLLHGIGNGVVYCLSLINGQPEKTDEEQEASLARQNIHRQSVAFMLVLSYLLSPLNTMIHLKGKRWNTELYRNGTSGLFDLVHGTDPKLHQLMAQMPSLLRGPKPPLFFANRHLQFLPWMLQNEWHRQEGIPYQRIEVEVTACVDKSRGTTDCERSPHMKDTITLDVFPPFADTKKESNQQQLDNGAPIIFFSPGLRCNSQDLPGSMIVRRAFGAGFRSVVVNRRGHTPNLPLQAPRWNLFGDVDDLEQVYWHVQKTYAAPHTPFFLHGISSGTALVVSALAQWDQRRLQGDKTAPTFVGSISVTPGYDISRVLMPQRFKARYNPLLTESVKQHFIRDNEPILRQFNNEAVDAALAATHLQDLLDASAPFAGYPNATAYYRGENPVNGMHQISTPKLVLNSIDDPCCHVHNIYDASPYPQHNGRTYAQLVADSPRVLLAVTESGSHCPFLDTAVNGNLFLPSLLPALVPDPYNGGWMLDSWADRISIEFYQAALVVYGEERRLLQ